MTHELRTGLYAADRHKEIQKHVRGYKNERIEIHNDHDPRWPTVVAVVVVQIVGTKRGCNPTVVLHCSPSAEQYVHLDQAAQLIFLTGSTTDLCANMLCDVGHMTYNAQTQSHKLVGIDAAGTRTIKLSPKNRKLCPLFSAAPSRTCPNKFIPIQAQMKKTSNRTTKMCDTFICNAKCHPVSVSVCLYLSLT